MLRSLVTLHQILLSQTCMLCLLELFSSGVHAYLTDCLIQAAIMIAEGNFRPFTIYTMDTVTVHCFNALVHLYYMRYTLHITHQGFNF